MRDVKLGLTSGRSNTMYLLIRDERDLDISLEAGQIRGCNGMRHRLDLLDSAGRVA
jgi:hypothetical protein